MELQAAPMSFIITRLEALTLCAILIIMLINYMSIATDVKPFRDHGVEAKYLEYNNINISNPFKNVQVLLLEEEGGVKSSTSVVAAVGLFLQTFTNLFSPANSWEVFDTQKDLEI